MAEETPRRKHSKFALRRLLKLIQSECILPRVEIFIKLIALYQSPCKIPGRETKSRQYCLDRYHGKSSFLLTLTQSSLRLDFQALNVVIRMEPSLNYPFNIRSFFTDRETKDIGGGIILWRGYFQSIRPAIGRMLINVDISTGTMYKSGNLLDLCKEFIGRTDPNALAPRRGFPDRERIRLQRFLSGLRVNTINPDTSRLNTAPRAIKKLSTAGASDLTFTMREGETLTVAEYFRRTYNRPLVYPDVLCAEVSLSSLFFTLVDWVCRLDLVP
jgi:Argonaute linker 1 domain